MDHQRLNALESTIRHPQALPTDSPVSQFITSSLGHRLHALSEWIQSFSGDAMQMADTGTLLNVTVVKLSEIFAQTYPNLLIHKNEITEDH